jgi:hypothetical protein
VFPPSRYNLISKLINVLVCLFNGRLSDIYSLRNLLAVLLVSGELSHHEKSDTSDCLRLPTSGNLETSDSLGHRASCIVYIHRQVELVCSSVSYLPGIQNNLVFKLRYQLLNLFIAA